MRAAITATTLCLSVSARSEPDGAEVQTRKETQIPAEELSAALRDLEKDRNLELIFVDEDVRGVRTQGARGVLTVEETLAKILTGTGLTYRYIDRRTLTIVPAHSQGRASGSATEKGRTEASQPVILEEVLVTAQKRNENVQDVPASVSVISGTQLEEWGATQLTDYAAYVSGLSVVQGAAPGTDMLILRGLSMPAESALVGTYIDDTPVGTSSAQQPTTRRALDLLPYDFERVEVLEGPQGTLYGANAMGGLVKYVTRKPDVESATARVGADLKENDNASAAGWNVRSALNVPIVTGKAAVRVSWSQDVTPGFIDEPSQNRRDGNQVTERAGHVATLFEPSDAWSIDISAFVEQLNSPDGTTVTLTPALTPDVGRLSDSQQVPQTFNWTLRYYSVSLNGDLQWASLVSATSYSSTRASQWEQVYYPLDYPTGRADAGDRLASNKLTQELRLVSPAGRRLEWLLGAFYTDERGDEVQSAYALDGSNVPVPNLQLNPEYRVFIPSRYREYALFGDVTWKFTATLDLTAGLRESRNEETFAGIPACSQVDVSIFGACPSAGEGRSDQNVFNFTVGPRYQFSPDVMTYFRVASGYRPGGPNTPGSGIPSSVAADTLIDSEVGIKAAWLDRKLRVDAAAYQIDWRHIQILSVAPPPLDVAYATNGNTATVRGIEAATIATPICDLHLGLNLTYDQAFLSAPMPSGSTLVGDHGDRLPYVPTWSGSLTADYTHALEHGWMGTLGVGWHYTGQRYTTIDDSRNCPVNCGGASSVPSLRPYGAVDMHARVSNDLWSVRFNVRNLTNKYALVDISGNNRESFDVPPILATVLSGRLFTLGVDRNF
jgi:iron complex outermembrane recepter protein